MGIRAGLTARRARPSDWLQIETLNQTAQRALCWLWWWEEYLGGDLFVVVEHGDTVMGALFVSPDGAPVAWVRLVALGDALDAGAWLDTALPPILAGLRQRGVRSLAWMDYAGWAGPLLGPRGFERVTDVVTLLKRDRALPDGGVVDAFLRKASEVDIPAILAVDRAALGPHWWYGKETMRRRAAGLSHFAVAEVSGAVVGHAEGELRLPVAHLDRIAVHPDHQGRGIGTALMRDALQALWLRGATRVTLNTQSDNRRSQQLYRRFGFRPTGDVMTAWELPL